MCYAKRAGTARRMKADPVERPSFCALHQITTWQGRKAARMNEKSGKPMRERIERALLLALLDRDTHSSRLIAVGPESRAQLSAGELNLREIARVIAEDLEGEPQGEGTRQDPDAAA
jgi:hypothetical protein